MNDVVQNLCKQSPIYATKKGIIFDMSLVVSPKRSRTINGVLSP